MDFKLILETVTILLAADQQLRVVTTQIPQPQPLTPGGGTPVVPPVNQALLDALALRDAALAKQLGLLNEQFSFATDDYYNQLGTDYREGGLSEAFTTAYDDAVRGIYDVYKSRWHACTIRR